MKFETRALHTGIEIDEATGASSVPIYQASTFHQASFDESPQFDYARSGNPTRQAVERAIAELEGAARGFAFASGMAAITSVFLLFETGSHIVAGEDIYGGTFRALTRIFSRLGIEVSFVDATDLAQIEAAIRPNTKAIYVETPSNPKLAITDLKGVAQLAHQHHLLSIVDNTFMSPYLQRPHELGFDIVVHSATKFLGGHSDVIAGVATVRDEQLGNDLYLIQNGFGAVLGPQDCFLLLRGLKTLPVRMRQSQAGAMAVAEYLSTHSAVSRVYYPGLAEHPGKALHDRQAHGPGAVLSFELKGQDEVRRLVEHMKLPLFAVSLGAVESILSYPVKMSHASMPAEQRARRGITDGLLRLSVGLEDPDDLILDLSHALSFCRG